MKKVFGFFVFFIFIFSGFLSLNINNLNSNNFNLNREASCGSEFVSVTTSTEFMDAANANENICVENDIDFSDISADESIATYSGIIDGQFYTLSNRNIKEEYINEDFNYFFLNFSGKIKNIKFDNFPFLFKKISGENDSSSPDVENVTYQNIDIENIYFENQELSNMSLFIASGSNIYVKNIAFLNINFSNNTFKEYNATNENFYFGLFGGNISSSNLGEIYFMNVNFDNNIFNFEYTDSTLEEKSNILFRFGLFIGRCIATNLNDVFVNNLSFTNNTFIVSHIYFSLFIGAFSSNNVDGLSFSRIYTTNVLFQNNNFYFDSTQDELYFSSFVANFYSAGKYLTFNSIVVEQLLGIFATNSFYDWNFNIRISVFFGEISGEDITQELVNFNDVYFVNDSGSGEYYNYYAYTKEDQLTLDFWTNIVNFGDSSIWNLDILFDKNLNISKDVNDEGEIYGFPLFTIFNYINLIIDDSLDNYSFYIDYVPSESATYTSINSIFGESQSLDTTQPNSYVFDTGISTEIPITNLKNYYWFDLEKDNEYENNILIGDINSLNSKTLYENSPEITNEIEFDLDGNNINYVDNSSISYEGQDDYDVLLSNPEEFYVTLNDIDGNSYTFSNENTSVEINSNILFPENINYFYQIDLENSSHVIKYLDSDKEIKEQELSISENSVIWNTETPSIEPLSFVIYNHYEKDDQGSYLEFNISYNGYFETIDQVNSTIFTESIFTIKSTFYEFNDENDPNIEGLYNEKELFLMPNFELNPENYNLSYKLYLQSSVPKSRLNQFYSIEINPDASVYYYSDLSGTSTESPTPVIIDPSSDLTNTSDINEYDNTQNLQLSINTSYNLEENTLYFTLEQTDFSYSLFYNVNLILYSENNQEEINLNSQNKTASIELDPSIPYNLEKDPESTINDYYSLGIDTNQSEVFYLNESGFFEGDVLDSLVLEGSNQTKSVSNSVIIAGDLTNITIEGENNNLKPIIPETQPSNINQKFIYLFVLLVAILYILFIIFVYNIKYYRNK